MKLYVHEFGFRKCSINVASTKDIADDLSVPLNYYAAFRYLIH